MVEVVEVMEEEMVAGVTVGVVVMVVVVVVGIDLDSTQLFN